MRLVRFAGFVLLGQGVLLLALVPLVNFYVLPRVEVVPQDQQVTVVSTGVGSYLDRNSLEMKGPVPLTVTTHVVADVAAGQASGNAVWNVSTVVDSPDSLPLHDPRFSVDWTLEKWVADRHTGLPVHCCGESPVFDQGYYLKFPFGVQKHDYQLWNPKAKHAFPVHYTGTINVEGHDFYRFDGTVPPTKIAEHDVPGQLVGLPRDKGMVHVDEYYADSDSQLLVDPRTGVPLGGSQHPHDTLRTPGDDTDRLTVLDSVFTATPDTEHTTLGLIVDNDKKLAVLQDTLPPVGLFGGSALLGLGLLLTLFLAIRDRRAAAAADDSTSHETEWTASPSRRGTS